MMSQHIVRLIVCLFLSFHFFNGMAQPRIIHLGLEQGMSNGRVVDMVQDRQGRVWMATDGGLHCWDGYRFTVYDQYNSPLPSNELNTVLADDDGETVWIGTRHEGMCRLNTRTGEWKLMNTRDGLLSNAVTRLIHATDGGIWVAYYLRGIDYMAPDGTLTHYSNEQFPSLIEPFWTAVDDGKGNLYIGHVRNGLSVLDMRARTLTCYPNTGQASDTSPIGDDAYSLCWDAEGNLWTATVAGVSVFSPREHRYVSHIPTSTNVLSLLCRRSGEMLVGVGGDGVFSMMEDRQGNLWKADGRRGVSVECHEHPLFVPFDTLFLQPVYPDIEEVTGTLRDGDITYVGTTDGFYEQKGEGTPLRRDDINRQLDMLIVTSVLVDRQGKLWLSTFGGGVYVFTKDGKQVAHHHYDPSPDVNMMILDSKGRVWMAHHHGLSVFDDTQKPEQMRTFSRAEGVQNLIQMALCEDAHGRIWTSNGGGISCIDPETGVIRNYTYNEGIPYDGFVARHVVKLPDGRIVFGQQEGACVFHPDSVSRQRTLPSVFISSFTLLTSDSETGAVGHEYVPLERVTDGSFAYDANSFQIAIGIDDLSKADAVEFQYRLTAGKGQWYEVGVERLITIQNSSPGTYDLEVRARLHNEPWSEPFSMLSFTVRQPWWWTWWMRLLYVVILVTFLWYQWHLYQQRLLLRRRLAERLAVLYSTVNADQSHQPQPSTPSESGEYNGTVEDGNHVLPSGQSQNRSDWQQKEERKDGKENEKTPEPNRVDREFLERLDSLILKHLDDPALDIQFLTTEMYMSYSTLYRRLKELTGMSANEYVRRHRLANAMQLLRDGYNVTEVSDRCGFNSPKYFSLCFKNEYGMSPSEVI